jgi:hypothetical protein
MIGHVVWHGGLIFQLLRTYYNVFLYIHSREDFMSQSDWWFSELRWMRVVSFNGCVWVYGIILKNFSC